MRVVGQFWQPLYMFVIRVHVLHYTPVWPKTMNTVFENSCIIVNENGIRTRVVQCYWLISSEKWLPAWNSKLQLIHKYTTDWIEWNVISDFLSDTLGYNTWYEISILYFSLSLQTHNHFLTMIVGWIYFSSLVSWNVKRIQQSRTKINYILIYYYHFWDFTVIDLEL